MHLANAIYKMLDKRSNITTSFTEHLKFQQQQKRDFHTFTLLFCGAA